MNILIFNWKDIKNPSKGGAEILTHEIAKGLVKLGHKVTMFVPLFKEAKKQEIIDRVEIIRSKNILFSASYSPAHFLNAIVFFLFHGSSFDIVIDELHGIPYFTPLYVKKRILFLVCEVANDIWDRVFPFPFNILGKGFEKWYFSLYKNKEVITISPSTKNDLANIGIPKKNIDLIPMGINRIDLKKNYTKEENPTYIFVGRMSKMKGIEDAIRAVSIVKKTNNLVKLWVVGIGDKSYVNFLNDYVMQLGIKDNVIFFGFISEDKKYELMAKSHAIIVPSLREGFGLIVPEANSVGTLAVVYNSPGLKDVVIDNKNGFVVKENSPKAIADILLKNYNKFLYSSSLAKKTSDIYNWVNTVKFINEKIYSIRTASVW